MKRLLLFPMLCVAAYSTTITFSNETVWQNAFLAAHPDGLVLEETFPNNLTSVPGLVFHSTSGPSERFPGPGRITNNQWNDGVGNVFMNGGLYTGASTLIEYNNRSPLYGFGAYFNISSSFKGLDIVGLPTINPFNPPSDNYPAWSGWWFVLTDAPFNYIQLYSNPGGAQYQARDWFFADPPAYAPSVPEPASLFLVGSALLAIGLFRKFNSFRSKHPHHGLPANSN